MNIALYGGAFNPIHTAHILLAKEVVNTFDIQKVLFMPTFQSPHKDTTKSVSYEDRMNMCSLAVGNDSSFEVSDLESKIVGKSYSYITLNRLKEIYPKDNLYMIIGADMYLTLLEWKNPLEIFRLANIITSPRDDGDYKTLLDYSKELSSYGCKTLMLTSPIMELSSTMIRENPKKAYESGYINKAVYDYIKEHNLYGVK